MLFYLFFLIDTETENIKQKGTSLDETKSKWTVEMSDGKTLA